MSDIQKFALLLHIWNTIFKEIPSSQKQYSLGRVAVIIGSGEEAANRGPCQCLPFRTLIARSLLCNCSPYQAAGSVPCVVYCSARLQAAIWQLGASQSWWTNANHCSAKHSPPPSCASSACLSIVSSNHSGHKSWVFSPPMRQLIIDQQWVPVNPGKPMAILASQT